MLVVSGLVKTYDKEREKSGPRRRRASAEPPPAPAVDGVEFRVEKGELFTLLGPSGCGKTTTLRSIAGLETPDAGLIEADGRVLFSAVPGDRRGIVNVPAEKRALGMVFQSYAIWPHMSVFDNVAFPLRSLPRSQRPGRPEVERRVHQVLETMELGHLAERYATKLSGGQQQRLALARAIVTEPGLLLLDEPLSNLDAKLRESLRFELKRLQRDLGITSIYVTHDQEEALALSSNIAVMRNGRILQLGKPREIYERPTSRFVAEFIGTSNFIDGRLRGRSGDRADVDTTEGRLVLTSSARVPVGSDVVVSIRPESVSLTTERPIDLANVWEGKVVARAFLGDAVDHVVAIGGHEIRARCPRTVSIEPGSGVFAHLDQTELSLVPVD